jgi:thiol-disulfide isomerase/thioredoxin
MFPRLALLFAASLVNDIRTLIARHDLVAAQNLARAYQTQLGATPDLAAGISWIARGALESGQLDLADSYATAARNMTLGLVHNGKLDENPWLPLALGNSIEVQADIMAKHGERAQAITFLRQQLALYGSTSLGERIRKNLNILNLEGKPAPLLDVAQWLGAKPPTLASLRGKPVLLFFWAHWCGDCKGEAPILASMMSAYGSKGLTLIAPTKFYGYVARGEDATPAVERPYIEQIRRQFYPMLDNTPIPLSAANFLTYGASTTPTIVLLDRAGIVRLYHPGAMQEQELSAHIEQVLRESGPKPRTGP